jgi:hypothetical protein
VQYFAGSMGSSKIFSTSLLQILYVSQLAGDAGFAVVKDIVQASRSHNRSRGITGALLFDGERFCQLLEGSEGELVPLMSRIEGDERHVAIRTLHRGPAGSRALRSWRSGYCESAHDLDAFDGAQGLSGPLAVQRFVALAKAADLD